MDPVTAISGAVDSVARLANTGLEAIFAPRMAKWANIPEWLSPKDFQQEDHTMEIILGGIALAFIALMVAIIIVTVRKK